jgi:hypothetical protein
VVDVVVELVVEVVVVVVVVADEISLLGELLPQLINVREISKMTRQ